MNLFLDTNVLLDGLFQRTGGPASDELISRCGGVPHTGWIAWHSLSNAYYLVRGHTRSSALALQFIEDLLGWTDLVHSSKADALWAVRSGMRDFEDALQLSAAVACGADILITRNTADFKNSPIPVMTPEAFLAAFS